MIPGRVRFNRGGKGFFQPEDPRLKEIFIPESAAFTALHEDRVLVRREAGRGPAGKAETGRIVRVLERKRSTVVGTAQRRRGGFLVTPDDPRFPGEMLVPEARDVGRAIYPGDKVVVRLREWASPNEAPTGEIIEVLGAPDEEGVDMLSVLRQYQLPLSFPDKVLAEARSFGTEIPSEDISGRQDCRGQQVVTIDPDDAKDFDDAICLERADAHWKLWVHIADVSHYVKPGSALDVEARRRGNSTYLVDRVIPMLPEALSNELCSLKPNVDRLTKCVEFLISDEGRVLKTDFYSAVIHSQKRFSYQEALGALQRAPETPIEQMLHEASRLAQRIRRLRFKAGSLDLDFPENKIRLDAQGRVLRIERMQNDISHQLIEEFMLLANEAVASRLIQLRRPVPHRVHEAPSNERLKEYRETVIAHQVPCGDLSHRAEVQKLLARLNTLAAGQALKIGFLKSLMRARYATEPLGHYGLSKANYAHFTSPIRRYADLLAHRALFEPRGLARQSLQDTADHISATERNSADAERDSREAKLLAFFQTQLATGNFQAYDAMVTDIRHFGFFVDLADVGMGGLVHMSSLRDDVYRFDAARRHWAGRNSRRVIQLGDKVKVRVWKVDSARKLVDFTLLRTDAKKRHSPLETPTVA